MPPCATASTPGKPLNIESNEWFSCTKITTCFIGLSAGVALGARVAVAVAAGVLLGVGIVVGVLVAVPVTVGGGVSLSSGVGVFSREGVAPSAFDVALYLHDNEQFGIHSKFLL